ncbi:hypothetical protein [Pedobacter aquatilis]|uniref:hypothetical protein n=1 Tax=Pedobacter aquatilis TaxID=351343 RepID=UPI00292D5598|nr:hypothetical protein [Pedobacter aquatilis]
MNTVFNQLQELCNNRIRSSKDEYSNFDKDFQIEAIAIQKKISFHVLSITNSTQIKAFFDFSMQELTIMCDSLFNYFEEDSENKNVLLLLEILTNLRQTYKTLVDADTRFPVALRKIYGKHYKIEFAQIRDSWKSHKLSEKAYYMAEAPLNEFYESADELSWYHFSWIKRYLQYLRKLDFSESKEHKIPELPLAELLIQMDFNMLSFNGYCIQLFKEYLGSFDTREEQVYMIAKLSKKIAQLSKISIEPFYPYAQDCNTSLQNWLTEEKEFRLHYQDSFAEESALNTFKNKWKFHFHKWNAEQIGYFFKSLVDMDILRVDKNDDLHEQLSANCSSSTQQDIKPNTFKKKMYTMNQKLINPILKPIDKFLEVMEPALAIIKRFRDELALYRSSKK